MEGLIRDIISILSKEDLNSYKFSFLGHSFGSLVLFETLREMRRMHFPLPESVYVSGRKSPSMPSNGKKWFSETDQNVIELLKSKGGIPHELFQNKEFLEVFLPIIRSDFKLIETYQYTSQDSFDLQFHVINGAEDEDVSDTETMDWQIETSIPCQFSKMKGGHFYLLDNPAEFVKTLFGAKQN